MMAGIARPPGVEPVSDPYVFPFPFFFLLLVLAIEHKIDHLKEFRAWDVWP